MKQRQRVPKYPGVYSRELDRLFRGKPDVAFDICYRHEGRLVWEKVGALSEGYSPQLAANVRAERTRTVRHGDELPRQKLAPLFKEVWARYLEWAKQNKRSWRDDEERYRLHLGPRIGERRLNEISAFDLERTKTELLKAGLSPATTKHCLVIVRQCYNKAVAWGLYRGANPIKQVKLPTLQNERQRFLSFSEADLLLSELAQRSPAAHDMALLSLHTGLRAGEVFGLRAHDIDLAHDLITVRDTNNATSRRTHMTGAVKEMLARRVEVLDPDSHVFADRHGHPFAEVPDVFRSTADRLFNKGVKDPRQRVTFHSCRHSHASWLAMQGESLLVIKEALGHKTLAMVKRYAHLSPDTQRRVALALEAAFNNGRQNGKQQTQGVTL